MAYNDNAGGYMAFSPQGGSQSPGGGERKTSLQSLRPVTIKQIVLAEQAHSDAEIYIDGVEVAQVSLVAQVINVTFQSTNIMYYLDDGTGKMEARKWKGDTTTDEDTDPYGIEEGKYVRVTGVLKAFNTKRYINASSIRPSDDPHELYFHLQEVAYVTMVHQRGRPGPKAQDQQQQNGPGTTSIGGGAASDYSAYTATSTTRISDKDLANLSPVGVQIIEFMRGQPPTDQGVHVAAITRAVKKDADAISNAIDELTDRGLLFSTINESHFSLVA